MVILRDYIEKVNERFNMSKAKGIDSLLIDEA